MANKVSLENQIIVPLIKKGWSIKVYKKNHSVFFATSPNGVLNGAIKFYFRSVSEQSRKQGNRHKLRLQVSEFTLNDTGRNALLGWSEKHGVFVAWNAYLHSKHGKSSMLSCYEETLIKASTEGYADGLRMNKALGFQEKYIAFDQDFLEDYLLNMDEIFNIPANETTIGDDEDEDELEAADEEFTEEDVVGLEEEDNFSEREEKKRIVTIKIRDYKFRRKLLAIYDHGCAVCQTKVVDILQGAHIVPVSHDGTDLEENGILLCANHHLMLDRNLIQIDEDFSLHVRDYLTDENWFKSLSEENGGRIYLPSKKVPSKSNLMKRLEILGKF
jgi:hypothetical protein